MTHTLGVFGQGTFTGDKMAKAPTDSNSTVYKEYVLHIGDLYWLTYLTKKKKSEVIFNTLNHEQTIKSLTAMCSEKHLEIAMDIR